MSGPIQDCLIHCMEDRADRSIQAQTRRHGLQFNGDDVKTKYSMCAKTIFLEQAKENVYFFRSVFSRHSCLNCLAVLIHCY